MSAYGHGDTHKLVSYVFFFFFFQAEDGIRDYKVTGVQTCALPICDMSIDVNRVRALDLAVSQIEKQFGKGAIMKLGEQAHVRDIEVVSTGSLGLDVALGVGGVPRGRVVEIYGPESSGKTTLALQVIAQAQKTGGVCAFIDAEHALDMSYARKLGVKIEDLLISQPDNGEQALE